MTDDIIARYKRALSAPGGDGFGTPSPAVVGDYTERARELLRALHCWRLLYHDARPIDDPDVGQIADALSAVASERDAAAIRAFGQRAWSDTEEVAYQAGAADLLTQCQEQRHRAQDAEAETMALLARLRGPDDAMIGAIQEAGRNLGGPMPASIARAVIARIAEMVT